MAVVCSLECAKTLAVSIRGKAEKQAAIKQRKADKVANGRLKTRREREAQQAEYAAKARELKREAANA